MVEDIRERLPGAEENILLRPKTTIRVGGEARYFYQAKTIDQLIKAVKTARDSKMPYLILGGGSNVILSDHGYSGLVIENRTDQIQVRDNQMAADSGVFLDTLVRNLAEQGQGGLEFLAGIPGTVGGAVVNNAGAFGIAIKDVLVSCLILDLDNQKRVLHPQELGFGYRKSKFKGQTEGEKFPVILRVVLKTKKSSPDVVLRQIGGYRKIREKKHPKEFSAGCIFVNPKIEDDMPIEWRERAKGDRISAGFLLDQAGAKGMRERGAMVSPDHANFIINRSRAKAGQIKALADKMKKLVKDKYGITLVREVEFIGKFD